MLRVPQDTENALNIHDDLYFDLRLSEGKVLSVTFVQGGQNMFRSGRMTLCRAFCRAKGIGPTPACLCHYITLLWPHLPGTARKETIYLCILLKWRWLSFLFPPPAPLPPPPPLRKTHKVSQHCSASNTRF